jgi:hypothetical protein
MITVILNGYKRPQFFKEQLLAIENQTIKPERIMFWQNSDLDFDVPSHIEHCKSNTNYGVWSRFIYALNSDSEYICVFDDDTIPGKKWLENCLNTMKTHEGLLGTVGLIFNTKQSYGHHFRVGWPNANMHTTKVDIVGHSWFFKREWLEVLFREKPFISGKTKLVGEDLHFSYMLQKYLNIDTYVPPHPINDRELWGSLKAIQYGTEQHAISNDGGNMKEMYDYYLEILKQGFKITRER